MINIVKPLIYIFFPTKIVVFHPSSLSKFQFNVVYIASENEFVDMLFHLVGYLGAYSVLYQHIYIDYIILFFFLHAAFLTQTTTT